MLLLPSCQDQHAVARANYSEDKASSCTKHAPVVQLRCSLIDLTLQASQQRDEKAKQDLQMPNGSC